MNLVLCITLAVAQQGSSQVVKQWNIDPRTEPALQVSVLKGKPCVSVSEIPPIPGTPEGSFWVRVFRYTYKDDFDAQIPVWEKMFAKKDGWELVRDMVNRDQFTVERRLKNPVVRRQVLIFGRGKFVLAPDVLAMTRLERVTGWIKVSYNEEYLKRPKPAKIIKRWP